MQGAAAGASRMKRSRRSSSCGSSGPRPDPFPALQSRPWRGGTGREAEMSHDLNFGVDDGLHDRQAFAAALQLDRLGPGPDESCGVAGRRLALTGVVAQPGQVGHDHRARVAAGDGRRVMNHVVHGHVRCVVVTKDDPWQRSPRRGSGRLPLRRPPWLWARRDAAHHHQRLGAAFPRANHWCGLLGCHLRLLLVPSSAPWLPAVRPMLSKRGFADQVGWGRPVWKLGTCGAIDRALSGIPRGSVESTPTSVTPRFEQPSKGSTDG